MRDQIVSPRPRAGLEWPHLIPSSLVLVILNTDSYEMHLIRTQTDNLKLQSCRINEQKHSLSSKLSCKLWNSHTVHSEKAKESKKLCEQQQQQSSCFQRLNLNLPFDCQMGYCWFFLWISESWLLAEENPILSFLLQTAVQYTASCYGSAAPSLPPWLSSILSLSPWQSHTVTLQLLMQQLSGFFLWSNCTAKDISQGHSLPE